MPWRSGVAAFGALLLMLSAALDARLGFDVLHPGALVLFLLLSLFIAARAAGTLTAPRPARAARPADTARDAHRPAPGAAAVPDRAAAGPIGPRGYGIAAATFALAAVALCANALLYHSRSASLHDSWRPQEEAALRERASRLRAEFAALLDATEAPIRRARELARTNPKSGAPSDSLKAFGLIDSLLDGATPDAGRAVSIHGPEGELLAWSGPSRPVPPELLVLSIPDDATKWLIVEEEGLSHIAALARPWRGSDLEIVVERVVKSVFDRQVVRSAFGHGSLNIDLDRTSFSDFRKPPMSLSKLFDEQGDLVPGPDAGRPALHVAMRAPDGALLGYASLVGYPEARTSERLPDRHRAIATLIVILASGFLVGVLILPRTGAVVVSFRRELILQALRLCGIWLFRFLLLVFQVPLTIGGDSLADPAFFSRSGLLGLLRSPQDAFLTSLAALASGILVSLTASRLLLESVAGRRVGARFCFLIAILIAFLLGTYIPFEASEFVHNARVDVLTVRPFEPAPARVCLQLAAAFTLLGFVLPLATLGWCAVWAASPRRTGGAPPPPVPTEDTTRWILLLLAPCAFASCAILEISLQPAATHVLRNFLSETLAPTVRAMPTLRRFDLDDAIDSVRRYPALADRIVSTDPSGDPTLAYDLWSATPIGPKGYSASLTVGDAEGVRISRFSLGFPPVLDLSHMTMEARNPPPDVITDFIAGPRERQAAALHLHTEIMRDDQLAGIVTIHLRNDFADIPPLTQDAPLLHAFGEEHPLSPLLEPWARTVGIVVYDHDGVPVPPSPRDPPPAPPESERLRILSDFREDLWRARAVAGGTVHELFFSSADHVVGLSFLAPGPIGRAARAIKLAVQTILFLIVLMAPWSLFSGLRLEWRFDPVRLLQTLSRTHYRRLVTTFLMAAIAPLTLLAFGLTEYMTAEIEQDVSQHGWTIFETARRQLEDFAVFEGQYGAPVDAHLFSLSENIGGEELSLFVNGELRATSNAELYSVGALPPRLDGRLYQDIVLRGRRAVLGRERIGDRNYRTINGSVSLGLAGNGVLSILLTGQRAEVERRAQEVYDALLLTTATIVMAMTVLAYFMARRIAAPIRGLSAAAARIAMGDLDSVVASRARDETGDLVASFNAMARALKRQREELAQRGDYIEKILLNATTGVLSVDVRGRIVTINPAAVAILGLPNLASGQDLLSRLGESRDCAPLLKAIGETLASPGAPREVEAQIGPEGKERHARARIVPFTEGSGLLIFLDDVTETVRVNRLAAWAEMARRIAHEIKNPLTPIQLAADHIRRVFEDGSPAFAGVLRECLRTIHEQVGNLREIALQFSHYARVPEIRKEPTQMQAFLEDVIKPYMTAPPDGVVVECDLDGPGVTLDVDRSLLSQAFVNLIENALQAMPGGGHLLMTATRSGSDSFQVVLADTGIGMDREALARAFEPYFSTKGTGTGLGMAIARRAIEEHRGRIDLTSAPGQGTTVKVTLPMQPPA